MFQSPRNRVKCSVRTSQLKINSQPKKFQSPRNRVKCSVMNSTVM